MATNILGRNITFPIYNADGSAFHDLELKKATVDSVVMSLGDKITGDVYYKDNTLLVTMQEYVEYKRSDSDTPTKYVLVNPPTIVKEGHVSENGELKGMTKYSFEFYHPMYVLNNFPFADVATSSNEQRYLSENKKFSWIGTPNDYISKLNKNLENTEWIVVKSDRFPSDKDDVLSGVLTFDNNTIGDALKTFYETYGIPFVIDNIMDYEPYYAVGKRFKVIFGLPSNEIYDNQDNVYVFKMGQGVGLKNNSRTPRNNKIITRISGYGSEDNIPYGYPQIIWTGNQSWTNTKNDASDPTSYPIYEGIVGGRYVKLIKHPFTRNHLMPSIYSETVNKKVNPLADGYNPNIELIDYYDAITDRTYPYVNEINPTSPSYEIHEFENIKPEMDDGVSEVSINGCVPIDNNGDIAPTWDDSIDDDGNYKQSYFKITLPILSFDLYACAAITQEMEINMRSGACIGCTFPIQVNWDDYRKNFYDSEGNFVPDGGQRDLNKYPKSNEQEISIIAQKEYTTFGTIMPNVYQQPKQGDKFVVLGISLPVEYITNAEHKLDEEMKSYMLENNVYYFDYPLKFDSYFLALNTNILSQIRPNSVIRFLFAGTEMQLYVKQLTIKFGENVLPQYDITLTDNIEAVINQIGKVNEDVENLSTLVSTLRQEYSRNVWSELSKKLSRTNSDTAQGLITFLQGISLGNGRFGITNNGNAIINSASSPNFQSGEFAGSGYSLYTDENGVSTAEVDKLIVRMKAFFAELEIREVSYLGGNYIFSAAGSRIYYVEWIDDNGNILDKQTSTVANVARFRCFLYSDDGTTATINKWSIDDQARCQTFNIDSGVHHNVANKFYWRRVSEIGRMAISSKSDETQYQYIVFDNIASDYLSGSDIPDAGDAIAQMGNWTNTNRQGLIYLDLEGTNAPAIMEYSGVGEQHFSLPSPTLMLSPKKNIIYGEFHSVVDGQTNNETIDEQLQELIEALNDVKTQSDQKFEVWFGEGTPLPSKDNPTATPNAPASDWVTDNAKAIHVQDIYYDTTREPASNGGRAWRWVAGVINNNISYYWEDITDSDTISALEKISDVASDGKLTGGAEKVRVYIDWMRCIREFSEYTEQAEDYNVSTVEYTSAMLSLFNLLNDSNLTYLPNPIQTPAWLTNLSATTIIPSPSDYRAAWDNYYNALASVLSSISDAAYTIAEDAQQAAEDAQLIIDDIVADNKLDSSEKQTIKREFIASLHEMIDSDDNPDRQGLPSGIIDRAKDEQGVWVVDYTMFVKPYEDAFIALGTYLNGDIAWNIPTLTSFVDEQLNVNDNVLPEWIQNDEANVEHISRTETIVADVFRKKWSDFFSTRTSLLTALTKNAQQTADDAQQDIDTIASDNILSRVEKKEVRKEWESLVRTRTQNLALASAVNLSSLPSSQQGGYGEGGTAILNAYNTTFTNLGKYMNGDLEEGATSQWDTTSIPLWISDAQMDVDQPIVPTTYRQKWYVYYESEIKVLNAIAAMTKSESERALQAIADIAADGIVTPSEKETLILQWNAVISELPPLLIQADANRDASAKTSTAEKQQVAALRTAYVNAFQNLADYMNGGETYTWQYTSPQSFPTLAWFNAENKGRNETVTAAAFTNLWSTYFDTRNALQKYIIDISRRPGDDALDELYDLASDGKLTAAEKLTVKREWLAINEEYEDLQVKARQGHVDVTPLRAAYNVLSNYLDDLSVETANYSDYINEDEGEIVVPRDIDDSTTSDVNATLFNERWTAYYSARTNLLATSLSKASWFVGVDVPTPPYKVGDLWMKLAVATDVTGVMMICIQSRDTAPGSLSDWTPYSNVATDISLLMSALVIKAYQYVAEAVEGGHTVRVRLGTAAADDYDLAYYNGEVAWWVPGRSNTITDDRLQTAMANLMEVIGRKDFRIVAQKNALVAPAQYDIVAKPITFTDPNLPVGSEYRTVKGGLEILMYDGRQWIVLQESTRNLMESLPGYMRFVVFGSADGTIESSGIMLQQDFATMFSEAVDDDTNIVKRAEIGTFVTKNPDTKEMESGVKISGDQIIMAGKTIINNKFVVAGDGSVILTDLTVNGNSSFAGDVFLSGSKGLSLRGTTDDENVRIKAENIDASDVYLSQSFHSEEQTATKQRTDATASSQTLYGDGETLTVPLNGGNAIKAGANVQMLVMIHGATATSTYINPGAADITVEYDIMQGSTTRHSSSVVLSSQTMSLLYFPISIPEYTIQADGNYSLCIKSIALSNITSQCSLYGHPDPVTTVFSVRHNIVHVPRTVIGQNGIAVSAGLNKWLFASSDQIVARFGNSGIRMNDNGMQKLVVTSEGLEVWVNEAGVRRSVSGTYTAKTEDTLLLCETASGDVTVNLTSKAQYEGHIIRMRRSSPNGNVNVRSEFTKIFPASGTGLVASITISDNKMHSFLFSVRWYEL